MTSRTGKIAVLAATVAAIGIAATYVLPSFRQDPFAECRTSVVAGGGGAIGGPFTLTDQDGRVVTDRDVLSKPSLVYFGYTSCPDICPTDVARNAQAVDILEEMGLEVTPVFISVDPRRDTPAVLKPWVSAMHPSMIGLTGTPEQLAEVAREYKTYFKVPDNPADNYYPVDHMTNTYLMLPQSGFADFFKSEDPAEDIANRVACFLNLSK